MTRLQLFSAVCILVALTTVVLSPEFTHQFATRPYLQTVFL